MEIPAVLYGLPIFLALYVLVTLGWRNIVALLITWKYGPFK